MMRRTVLLMSVLLLSVPVWGRVFVGWTEPDLPPSSVLGVADLAAAWEGGHSTLIPAAIRQGFHVYAEVAPTEAKAAADAATREGLAGIIVKLTGSMPQADTPERRAMESMVRDLEAAHPGISVRVLEPGGKQPQLRGTMVVDRNGVLQVSSPTRQPWIDSNVAFVRFERTYRKIGPPLVDFAWNLADSVERKIGPPTAAYELAVAEEGAFEADLVLPLHQYFQKKLAAQDPPTLASWNEIRRYVQFYVGQGHDIEPVSNVGIVADSYESCYEAVNLMARHNIPFHFLTAERLKLGRLQGLSMLVIFHPLDDAMAQAVDSYAAAGGTAVLVGSKGPFKWEVAAPLHQNSDSAIYADGAGKVVEVAAPVLNPEPFAQDIWRMLSPPERLLSLWNALTTLGMAYQNKAGDELLLDLVNYSGQSIRVQVRVKGRFSEIRYETPEQGCCATLTPADDNGFTEFVVPSLAIGGRAHLSRSGAR